MQGMKYYTITVSGFQISQYEGPFEPISANQYNGMSLVGFWTLLMFASLGDMLEWFLRMAIMANKAPIKGNQWFFICPQ